MYKYTNFDKYILQFTEKFVIIYKRTFLLLQVSMCFASKMGRNEIWEVEHMKICPRCKRLHSDTYTECTECRKPLRGIESENEETYLITAEGFEREHIRASLQDAGIPCVPRFRNDMYSSDEVTGKGTSLAEINVPFSAFIKAYDTCVMIGAIDPEKPLPFDMDEAEKMCREIGEKNKDKIKEEMSPSKRTTYKVLGAVLFLLLVAVVVWGTDFITAWIKGLFGG